MQSCRSKLTNAWRGARHWRKVGDALKKGKFLHVKRVTSKDWQILTSLRITQ